MLSLVKTAEITSFIMIAAIVAIFVFQLIVPAIMGQPLFPVLRHKRRDAESRLSEALEAKEVEEIEKATANVLGNATTKRRK